MAPASASLFVGSRHPFDTSLPHHKQRIIDWSRPVGSSYQCFTRPTSPLPVPYMLSIFQFLLDSEKSRKFGDTWLPSQKSDHLL
ncbi:hypothetical protein PILCRDRAFT_339630 [Piloderma croceum F 1598]|uniref:Uncharacterized protein n=1 Tax=Piloderma croceum (strain F 1598) TaxID=765440 RepID=A0A0C3FP49_PILCF|nr:hypothetical protein PILCRDRAFT_339630 [Piloderma croceum F 1598]